MSPSQTEDIKSIEIGEIGIEVLLDSTTGYVSIQNNVPVIRAITLTNSGDQTLVNIEILIGCSPAFAVGSKLHFERLLSGESRKISPIDLQPDHGYLSILDEAERASITISAKANGQILAEAKHDIEVLAYDQWAGTRSLPELLAAFCMPNSPVVDKLIAKASKLLRQNEPDASMNGYQSKNRERVWKQVSAVYTALLDENLQYSTPPASFGIDGQKIRTPERIMESRIATCLDLAMLFASVFEQAGLHSVVLFKDKHAWVGVWLIETNFPTAVVDDVQAIRKRVKSGELIVFESTGIASGQKPSLRWACSTGEQYLDEDDSFHYVVDIRRARELQIRALPSKVVTTSGEVTISVTSALAIEDMPALPPLDPAILPATELANADTPEGRLGKWKAKLLDLTLRNRLLNFKPTKSNLRLVCPDPAALEDSLSEGKEFRIRALPKIMEGQDPRESGVFVKRSGKSPQDALAEDALSRREIIVDVTEESLEGRLLEIYSAAVTGLEEGGANTLFLAFGLLQWREEQEAEISHLAPILLIPVTLTRQSVRSGYRLTRHDDDALVNPTLIQKLWQDFNLRLPSFDPLPTDEHGLDVGKILQVFRLQVGEQKGWEVKDHVHLGIFSFTKYLMWKDLQDRQQQLLENSVVAHLVNNPGKVFADSELGVDHTRLDETHKPQDLFAPLLSDSSQLRAICVANDEKNLVIEGPPGTGKSQTITNLIAHLLATGKTVLFVSEKMAALEVVHRRLNQLDLGPFCLELHSSKAKKSDVLKQLGTSLDAANSRTVRDWDIEAERLAALRQELNGLAMALHRVHPNDLTIYEALGTCIKNADEKPATMEWSDSNVHTRVDLDALRSMSRQMAALASQLSNLSSHPLLAITKVTWTPSWQQELLEAALALSDLASKLQDTAAPTFGVLGIPEQGLSLKDYEKFDVLSDVLIRAASVPTGIAKCAHDETMREKLRTIRIHGLERSQAWNSFGGGYREETTNLNGTELQAKWADAQATWWPRNWFAKRELANRLRLFRDDKRRPTEQEVGTVLPALVRINSEDKKISSLTADASAMLQDQFAAHLTDWGIVATYEQWSQEYSDAVSQMAGRDTDLLLALRTKLQFYTVENRAMLKAGGVVGSALIGYRDTYRSFVGALHKVMELGGCQDTLIQDPTAPSAITRLLGMLQGWQVSARQLQPWCLWRSVRAKAVNGGLSGVVRALESGQVPLVSIAEYFEYSYQDWWLRKAIDRESVLCSFSSTDHERKILEFRKSDELFQELTKQYIVARLSGQIPSSSTLVPGADSEMGKLRRELQKQRKHMPIRQLVQNLPTLLPKLKPCLLMSPLSVSQYLNAGHAQFDVVVFDEASQIPVWDAVGAIARGKQLICVGDPKQLPPTNFFNRVDGDEISDGEDDFQDLESILDECLSIGLPKLSLDWHYRSKHESLITFSNVTYYDNRLITFPSPVTEDRAVRFEPVHGVYDRGGSRTNRSEAEAIIRAIEQHYLSSEGKKYSLGVVTFNQAQQNLIENLLDARRRASSALDQAIAQAGLEPLFIKNLENVQGDERDIIYFSVTYGPDATGKVSLNFGPLNMEGGHRRLNVAVSRARHGVVIFSTLRPEQIDLSKVRAAGVRDLKNYLDFALRGPRALVEQVSPTGMDPDSPFEVEVINALREKGWGIHPQVGVSGYRIDIGVVDPRAPGRYLLGVECDGRTYHSGANARDRDRLRHLILEGLGWQLHRIWSTDWWLNPQEPMRKLLARLEQLVTEDPNTVEGEPTVETLVVHVETIKEAPTPDTYFSYGRLAQPSAESTQTKLKEYRPLIPARCRSDHFYEGASKPILRQQLLDSVNVEGPIADFVVFRRIARAWGLARTGKRIEEVLRNIVPETLGVTIEGDISFYWPAKSQADQWEGFRVAGHDPMTKRPIDEVCLEELGNLAIFILSEHGNTSVEDLVRSICRLLGIARTTADAEERILKALSHGRVASLIQQGNGLVRLLD